jgi:K+-transporting ATPase ATPase C chain
MLQHLRACLWLLIITVTLCCVIYPLVLLGIGKTIFPNQAGGSLVTKDGTFTTNDKEAVGSSLIAQPFSGDKYFQPRPSATSPAYNAAGSGASNWAANNYLLRDRVARQLATIVIYASGPDKGKHVGDDVQTWFQKFDETSEIKRHEKPGIVAQWAALHAGVAQNWIKNDMTGSEYGLNGKYVAEWQKSHKAAVDAEIARLAAWKKDNPGKPAPEPKQAWIKAWIAAVSDPSAEPKPEDLAVSFFLSFSEDHPGMFSSAVEHKTPDGKTEKRIEPVNEGDDIKSAFFDMWLREHPEKEGLMEKVPGDMVMASGSGLDPHITLDNALWQLDHRIAEAWAESLEKKTKAEVVRSKIVRLLEEKKFAPLGGRVGVELVNVLEVNLALEDLFGVR